MKIISRSCSERVRALAREKSLFEAIIKRTRVTGSFSPQHPRTRVIVVNTYVTFSHNVPHCRYDSPSLLARRLLARAEGQDM